MRILSRTFSVAALLIANSGFGQSTEARQYWNSAQSDPLFDTYESALQHLKSSCEGCEYLKRTGPNLALVRNELTHDYSAYQEFPTRHAP